MSDLPPAYHTIDPNPVPSSTAENFDSIPVNPDQAAPCRLVDWNFVAIEAPLKHDFIYFTSHQALQQYKDFAKMGKDRRLDLAEYQEYVRLTRAGFGLPLIESDASFFTSLASTYMKIYRYQAPTMRPFNKHIDRFLFCLVEREQHTRYNKFVMTFTPNPANPDESFTVVMIEHTRIPIVDVSRYKGVKYRWMKNPDSRYTRDYSYSLHALQTNKISLTDGMKKSATAL